MSISKMSDLDEWKVFGEKWGFSNEVHKHEDWISLEWYAHEGTMKGYTGFSLLAEFDLDENFIKAGVWE